MQFQRFMRPDEFLRELAPLRAFGTDYVGTDLLESLESVGLLRPRVRVRYPDTIARRFWLETHAHVPCQLTHPIEPDGPRWDAAVALSNAFSHWNHPFAEGLAPHPLDDPEQRFVEFIQQPKDFVFERRLDRRVDVSSDVYEELFDDCNVDDYYCSWQILFAAEVANAGIYIRINLEDRGVAEISEQLREGRIPGNSSHSYNFRSVHAARDFSKYEKALDAIAWFAEERARVLSLITREHSRRGERRFRLTPSEHKRYAQATHDLACTSVTRFHVSSTDLMALIRFLAEYWSRWDREGRPLIADAYKAYLGRAVALAQLVENLSFDELRDRVGRVDGRFKPILDVVWPSWSEEEKERARLTLKGSTGAEKPGELVVSDGDIEAFVNFLAEEGLETFFWRLNSFESHAIRGNEFAIAGMKSDVQGMAVVVEHIAETLGGTETQLYAKFKQLWRDPDVLRLLNRGDVDQLLRNRKWARDWPALIAKTDALRREPGGQAAADLVMAYRVRGGVHTVIPEDDHLELEALFVGLMRAALRTFVEVRSKQ